MKIPITLVDITPEPNTTNVALNSPVIIKFAQNYIVSTHKEPSLRVSYKTQTQGCSVED
jgi:hypothetical protein